MNQTVDTAKGSSRRQLLTGDRNRPGGGGRRVNPDGGLFGDDRRHSELAPQWKKLNVGNSAVAGRIRLRKPIEVAYGAGGAQSAEKHRDRGSLEATIRVVDAARKAKD